MKKKINWGKNSHLPLKKLIKELLIVLSIFLIGSSQVFASNFFNDQQGRVITGKVTDNSRTPLPGVSVVAKGTTVGTILIATEILLRLT